MSLKRFFFELSQKLKSPSKFSLLLIAIFFAASMIPTTFLIVNHFNEQKEEIAFLYFYDGENNVLSSINVSIYTIETSEYLFYGTLHRNHALYLSPSFNYLGKIEDTQYLPLWFPITEGKNSISVVEKVQNVSLSLTEEIQEQNHFYNLSVSMDQGKLLSYHDILQNKTYYPYLLIETNLTLPIAYPQTFLIVNPITDYNWIFLQNTAKIYLSSFQDGNMIQFSTQNLEICNITLVHEYEEGIIAEWRKA